MQRMYSVSSLTRERRGMRAARSVALLVLAMASGAHGAEGELRFLGSSIRLGAAQDEVFARLRQLAQIRQIEGGWAVRSADSDPRQPSLLIGTESGLINDVYLNWGFGTEPALADIVEQLALAVPARSACEVSISAHPHEGGTVSRLRFECGREMTTLTVRDDDGVLGGSILLESK